MLSFESSNAFCCFYTVRGTLFTGKVFVMDSFVGQIGVWIPTNISRSALQTKKLTLQTGILMRDKEFTS